MTVFEEVRAAARAVAERAHGVHIEPERLRVFAREVALASASATPTVWDPAHHHVGDVASTVAFVLTLDAVNFGSGWFPHLAKRPGCSGYLTIATCLKDRFEREGPLLAAELRALDAGACFALFEQDPANREIATLMEHFARSLHDLGRQVEHQFGGRFEALVAAAGGRAEALVRELVEMPLYRDVSDYDGLRVPFYKRAQITVMDLATAFEGRGPGAFRDLDALTCFADNLVPHVLRVEGVLRYDPALLQRIERGALLAPGSREEVEIRAVGLHAVEQMVDAIRAEGGETTAGRLDQALWSRGQRPEIKAHPRHRCRSTFY